MGGGEGSSGPTVQQQQLETEQAVTNANLNLEENSQRKAILNSMMGTRVYRGSALSRAVRGNTPGTGGEEATPAPSASQLSASSETPPLSPSFTSILDQNSSGATPAGGTGASATPSAAGRGAAAGARGAGGVR